MGRLWAVLLTNSWSVIVVIYLLFNGVPSDFPDRLVDISGRLDKYYLRVVIKYEQKKPPSNARGYVLTAFPSTKRKGDILIWQNSSL